jgi:hypothetical protein
VSLRKEQPALFRSGWLFELKWDGFRGIADTMNGRMLSYHSGGLGSLIDAFQTTGLARQSSDAFPGCESAVVGHSATGWPTGTGRVRRNRPMFSRNANEIASLFARIGEWWRNRRQRRADHAHCPNAHTRDALQSKCIVAARFPT